MATTQEIMMAAQKKYGEDIMQKGMPLVDVERLPSGVFPLDLAMGGGWIKGACNMIWGPESSGKCHAKGDKILLFNGTVRAVEDIIPGDVLMGVDSTPRKVLKVGKGYGPLFKITPVKGGGSFTVNGDHQLHLTCTHNQGSRSVGDKLQISVKDYLTKSNDWKIYHHLYRVGVEFSPRYLEIDPYFLGLWLGDGSSSNMQVYSVSLEIIEWLQAYADRLGGRLSIYDANSACPGYAIVDTHLRDALLRLNLFGNKHIPSKYLTAPRKDRLALLAGLLDTDGGKGSGSSCVFYTASQELGDQVRWLAQSLGYYASLTPKKTCCNGKAFDSWQVYISMDDATELPLLLEYKRPDARKRSGSCLTSRFTVEPCGEGEFFGFEVDGDHLYLTDGFIVNHNTNICLSTIRTFQLLNPDQVAVFVDAEHSFDPQWATKCGVNVDNLIIVDPELGEQVVNIVTDLLQTDDCGLVIVDSLPALGLKSDLEGTAEKAQVGGNSVIIGRLMKSAVLALSKAAHQGRYPTMIAINQVRHKVGFVMGNPEYFPGGNALKHYLRMIVRVYGKNVMVNDVSKSMPAIKHIDCVITKWKAPIVSTNAVIDMVAVAHNGIECGRIDDWNTVSNYAKDQGLLVKEAKGWGFNGEIYKTLAPIEEELKNDPELAAALKEEIIRNAVIQANPDLNLDKGD